MPRPLFKCNLTKSQIETLLGLICYERKLKHVIKRNGAIKLNEIAKITGLDYFGALHRNKDWLIETEILLADGIYYDIDYQAIAELLFDKSVFRHMYDFAFRHLEFWI